MLRKSLMEIATFTDDELATAGPLMRTIAERALDAIDEPRNEREYIDELEAETVRLTSELNDLANELHEVRETLKDIETCAICEFLKQGVEN